MIESERQYDITKAAAERFRHALQTLRGRVDDTLHPVLRTAHEAAIIGQLSELDAQIAAYESSNCDGENI